MHKTRKKLYKLILTILKSSKPVENSILQDAKLNSLPVLIKENKIFMKEGIHERGMKTIFRKNIHERGNSSTGNENHFQEKHS